MVPVGQEIARIRGYTKLSTILKCQDIQYQGTDTVVHKCMSMGMEGDGEMLHRL